MSPHKLNFYKNALISALHQYPDKAEFTIQEGALKSTLRAPVFLWMEDQSGISMLIFGANQQSTLQKNDTPEESLVFLGANQMRISFQNIKVNIPYSHTTYSINKQTVEQLATTLGQYLTQALPVFYVILFICMPIVYIASALEITLAMSILLFLVFRLFTKRVHLRKCIQAGLHATLFPIIIGSALFCTFPSGSGTLTIVCALIFVFQLVGIYEMYFAETSSKLHHKARSHAKGR